MELCEQKALHIFNQTYSFHSYMCKYHICLFLFKINILFNSYYQTKIAFYKNLPKWLIKCFVTDCIKITQLVIQKNWNIYISKLDFSPNSTDYLKFLDLARFHWEVNSNLLAAYRMVCPMALQTVASVELFEAEQKFMLGLRDTALARTGDWIQGCHLQFCVTASWP